jgi:hypothetical protein
MKAVAQWLVAGPVVGVAVCLALPGCGMGVSSDPGRGATDAGTAGTSKDADRTGVCGSPDTAPHPYNTRTELEALLIGKWLYCSGPPMISDSEAGIELVADHTYFKLVADGHGGYMRAAGFGNQGGWSTYDGGPLLVWHPIPAGGSGGTPQFEDQPLRMAIRIVEQRDTSFYSRIP